MMVLTQSRRIIFRKGWQSGLCMQDIWLEMQNHSGGGYGIVNRDRNTELPGGGDYFHAAQWDLR